MPKWIPKNSHPSSTMFVCPHCNNEVYFNHGSSTISRRKSKNFKHCPYNYCPWCGKQVNQYASGGYISYESLGKDFIRYE